MTALNPMTALYPHDSDDIAVTYPYGSDITNLQCHAPMRYPYGSELPLWQRDTPDTHMVVS